MSHHPLRTVLTTLLSLVVLAVGSPNIQADDTQLPPQVIDVWPLPGIELAPDATLTVTFDQPMNRASVEAAIEIEPSITLTLTWADERTLVLASESGWPGNQTYTVTIGASARSQNGRPLAEAYTFEVQTARPLQVASISPEDGAEGVAAEGARIIVIFDRPVVSLVSTADQRDLPTPITIEPVVPGTGEWVNTSIYVFTASAALRGNTTYRVTVPADLTAVDGATLTESVVSTFRTLAPQTLTIRATSTWRDARTILLDSAFEVSFSQPMDRTSSEAAFRLESYDLCCDHYPGNVIAGVFEWNEQSTKLMFTPDEPLENGRGYLVTIETGALSAAGAATLSNAASANFATVGLPAVRETTPQGGAIVRPGRGRVVFRFNTPMNTASYEGRYTISPQPEGEVVPYVYDDGSLALEFDRQLDTVYTVTLLPGIEDIYGNATAAEFNLAFFVQEDDVRTSVQPRLKGDFVIVGTYQDEPMLPVRITGSPTITLDIYSLNLVTLDAAYRWKSDDPYYYDSYYGIGPVGRLYYAVQQGKLGAIPWVKPENRLSTWTNAYDVGDVGREGQEILIPLAGPNGEKLPAGLYGVEITSPGAIGWNAQSKTGVVLAVSDVSLTVKSAPGEALVWVTDFASAEPVAGAAIQVFREGEVVAQGETDASGVFRVPEAALDSSGSVFIQAEGEGGYGIWNSAVSVREEATSSYLYTDRPIYRPGETVYYRGVIRERQDMDYTLPDVNTLRVTVGTPNYYDYYGPSEPQTPFYDALVDMTGFGTFSGAITLPDDLSPGSYTIYADSCLEDSNAEGDYCYSTYRAGITFEVAEFRVPEYEVKVTLQRDEIIAGDPVNALVTASYYFGGAVSHADITWSIHPDYSYYGDYGWDTSFRYGGERGYTFSDADYSYGTGANSERPYRTDAEGHYLVTAPVTISGSRPARMAVEATVADESGQAISARSSVVVHPASVYVGLRASSTFGVVGEAVHVDILTVTSDGERRPGQVVDLEVVEVRWVRHILEFGRYEWKTEIIPVDIVAVTTDARGQAAYTFTPPNAGIFRIRAVASDEKGRQASSAIHVYTRETGATRSRVWWDPYLYDLRCGYSSEYQLLRLTADSDSYRPGDAADIFVPNPFDGEATGLITVERAGVLRYEVLTIEGDALTYRLPITDEHAPTVYLGVVLMRGVSNGNPDPQYIRGSLRLNVEPVNRRLTVSVTPSAETVKPGDVLSFDVLVTDLHGDPVQAEVGLALNDEAALAMRPANSDTLEAQFYGRQPLRVTTSASIRALLRLPDNTAQAGCGGGGGGGVLPSLIREDFIYTPLWSPHTVTDEDGRAAVSVEMPDNLTRWRLDARAVTLDTRVGQTEINLVSTLPLLVRPVTPRFFVAGDRMPLAAVVNNNTDTQQVVDVTLQATGVQVEDAPLTQTVALAPGGRARVQWPVVVEDVEGVDITVFAVSPDYRDAAKPALTTGSNGAIPVYRYIAPETVRTGGILTEAASVTEAISLPPRLSDVGGVLSVQLDPSLASATLDGLEYLRNYPHQCIEQTVSRFLPNVVTYRALRDLNLQDAELKANLDEELDFALNRLGEAQNKDGGWGWFGGMESSPLTTAYTLLGLVEAQAADYAVDDGMLEEAASYLRRQLVQIELNTPDWTLNRQAFLLYVLARRQGTRQGGDSTTLLNAAAELYDNRLELSYAGRAFLLMAFTEFAPNSESALSLATDLSSGARLSATGAHWEEAETDWWNWGSDTRTTALALAALLRHDPQNPLLPNIVRWLMIARRGGHWQSTQETAWTLIALTDWMVTTGELRGEYSYVVKLNGDPIGAGAVTPQRIQDTRVLQRRVQDLLADSVNRLVIERGAGEGALYYAAALDLQLPADEIQPLSRGITVSREYFLNNDPARPISSAKVGDIITVRLSLALPQDIYYFVLEDILPAGTEVIDTRLLTSTDTVEGPALRRDDPRWYWGYWYFDKVELHDEGAALYADFLPRGAYTFTYQVRATSPGAFQVIPAQAYAFYQPEVFGRTEGMLFTVQSSG